MKWGKIIECISTFSSIIGMSFFPTLHKPVRYLIVFFACVSLIFLLIETFKGQKVNEIVCESDEEIKNAMKRIIKMQGKICIMSRDLSWVDNEIEGCITSKAESMLIFAQKETELTKRLVKKHVEVKYYGTLNFEPKTRFTMIRYNAQNPQVAISNTMNSIREDGKVKHTIYQTEKGKTDEWINSLAGDMVELCKLVCS